MNESTARYIHERRELTQRLKELIVTRLDLSMDPEWITDDQPLFGRGLELDSVDALELVSCIEYEMDVSIEDDDIGVFGSINSTADYIERHTPESEPAGSEGPR